MGNRVLEKSDPLWASFRRFFLDCPEFPLLFSSEALFQEYAEALPTSQVIAVVAKGDGWSIRHRYIAYDPGAGWQYGASLWGELLCVTGHIEHWVNAEPKRLVVSTSEGGGSIQDSQDAKAVMLLAAGRLSLLIRETPTQPISQATEMAALLAPWLDTAEQEASQRIDTLATDLGAQKRLSATVGLTGPFDHHQQVDFRTMDTVAFPNRGLGKFMIHQCRATNQVQAIAMLGQKPAGRDKASRFPPGATNTYERNGRKCFTSDQELGQPAAYSLDKFGNWRPDTRESIIIMHYGQSNASVQDGGGQKVAEPRCPWHVVSLNDRRNVRGLMGAANSITAQELVPANQNHGSTYIHSAVVSAAEVYLENRLKAGREPVQMIVRSEAKGAQPFIGDHDRPHIPGLHKNDLGAFSQVYKNLVSALQQSLRLAQAEGAPVSHIYIPFTHQEANRGDQIEKYADQALAFFHDVERDLAEYGVPITWVLDQAAGTNATYPGGAWPAKLALATLASRADNIRFLQPRYPYELYDVIHWTNRAKVLYGELLGHAITAYERGERFDAAQLVNHHAVDNKIVLTFDNETDLVLDHAHHPVLNSVSGFTLDRAHDGLAITTVTVTGKQEVTLEFNQPLPKRNLRICYAYRETVEGEPVTGWPVATGALRESWSAPSRSLPGETLYRWIPAFQLVL